MSTTTITAPAPGIFYRRPNPEDPPFVEEGDDVAADDVIGLIEVMKNYHEITADASGTLDRFLVENEAEIEVGDPLAEIDTG